MKKEYCRTMIAALALSAAFSGFAAAPTVTLGQTAVTSAAHAKYQTQEIVINGTGNTGEFTVNASNLPEAITLTASAGFEVTPSRLSADVQNATVRVKLLSTLPVNTGYVVLRSGDFRGIVPLKGLGTALTEKALESPVFTGTDRNFSHSAADGFTPGANGYTVEFRVQLKKDTDVFDAYAVTPDGGAFKAYIAPNEIGLYNGSSKIAFSNPANTADGGNASFYNADGKYHTYRFAVSSDKRVYAYRDGIEVAVLRTQDYGNQADWAIENGDIVENLLKNPGFEGEFNFRASDSLLNKVEGWILDPIDRYNCTYEVINKEINKDLDNYNHVMKLQRYNWNDGWGAGTVSQLVDVAPNSTYSLAFLAGGGMNTKTGEILSSVRIEEAQDSRLGTKVNITNEDGLEPYGLNYTTSADCRQIKVILHNERFLNGDGWGSSPKAFLVDEMVLTGQARVLDQKVGFTRGGGTLEYFTYDASGAYAPVNPVLAPAEEFVTFNGTGAVKDIKISVANLVSVDRISVTATPGFSVTPSTISATKDGTIRVKYNSTLPETDGKIILRAGDIRKYISLKGYGSELEEKSIKDNPVYAGGTDRSFSHTAADGFSAGSNGYTVEFRVKIDRDSETFDAYAVTNEGESFHAYIEPQAIGYYNGSSKIAISNPATAGDGGLQQFYNNDGKFHTYRYAVTTDGRINAWRDGIHLGTVRASDYGHDASWAVENGDVAENLLKNPGFEGEFNFRASDSLLNKVEGWILDPIDRYNCTYEVINKEINKDLDNYNHVMKLQRYNWNDGWGAGTVSQLVDVAPNSTYSLAFLAGGGMNTKTGEILSSVRIEEAQDSRLGTKVNITNEDGLEPYGLNYTTSADCRQIKVILHNERFLNGDGWGSSPKAFLVDEMVLTGVQRSLDQLVGFSNGNADIEYFTYEPDGAFAPLAPGFGDNFTGIDGVDAAARAAVRNVAGGVEVTFDGAASVEIYDLPGRLVAKTAADGGVIIPLDTHGVYIAVIRTADGSESIRFAY